MRTIAIIPARGGSKRIPGKNVKEFEGQPIIAYSIRAALGAGCFDEVMVSADSGEIAAVARRYGASVPFLRSEKTSDDYATTADVIREVLDRYARLDIAPYKGFVNPVYKPVFDKKGNIIDVNIDYTEGYIDQMLRYSKDYSPLTK